MKINVTSMLVQLNGKPIQNVVDGETQDATIREALVNALMAPNEKDSGVKKAEKYDLALQIYKEDEIELSAEQIVTIKECVGKLFAPIVVGQLFRLLDGKD